MDCTKSAFEPKLTVCLFFTVLLPLCSADDKTQMTDTGTNQTLVYQWQVFMEERVGSVHYFFFLANYRVRPRKTVDYTQADYRGFMDCCSH